jgi:enoyl-CoA hydratase
MTFDTLLVAIDGNTAVVTINRPDKLNALNRAVMTDLDACFSALRDNVAVRGIILTGAGEKAFIAGADIAQFVDLDARSAHAFALDGQAVLNRIEGLGKPVIAAVGGFALGGGCEVAMACHLRIASTTARFGQPEVGLGLIPGFGGTQRLPRLVGKGIATEMILGGAPVSAQRAFETGLVNKVVEPEALMDEARAMLNQILKQGPAAVALSLNALRASDLPLSEGLQHEAALFGQAFATEDVREGVSAFLERRKPVFSGR